MFFRCHFHKYFFPAISYRKYCNSQAKCIKETQFFKYLMKSHKDISCYIFPECIMCLQNPPQGLESRLASAMENIQ